MLVRHTIIKSISEHLGLFENTVRLMNSSKQYDINIHAENFLAPFLSIAYDLELINLNRFSAASFPSVDLGDAINRHSVQVTSSTSSSKVENTIELFLKYGLSSDYDHLVLLMIGQKQSKYGGKRAVELMDLLKEKGVNLQILDVSDLISHISSLPNLNRLVKLEECISAEITSDNIDRWKVISTLRNQANPYEHAAMLLMKQVHSSVTSYAHSINLFLEPRLLANSSVSRNINDNIENSVSCDEVLGGSDRITIRASAQFGLTTTALYLAHLSYLNGKISVVVNCQDTQIEHVKQKIANQLTEYGFENGRVDTVILDDWSGTRRNSQKYIDLVLELNDNARIILCEKQEDYQVFNFDSEDNFSTAIDEYTLLSLPRNEVRKVVQYYNADRFIDSDDSMLQRVVQDLESLNMHRTVYNVITIMQTFDVNYDESATNRSKMLELVLASIFNRLNYDEYSKKPDLKDVHIVLGHFIAHCIRREDYGFTKLEYLTITNTFCVNHKISLDTELIIDNLLNNQILVKQGSVLRFRNLLWVYYFTAHNMDFDSEFKQHVLDAHLYIASPSVAEFYAGIDRRKSDIVSHITDHLSILTHELKRTIGIPLNQHPIYSLRWDPSDRQIDQATRQMKEDVFESNLPDIVKDQHQDYTYDQIRPYNQQVSKVVNEFSVANLKSCITALSLALRNSDYINPTKLKRDALLSILSAIEELGNVILIMSPVLATKDVASFSGWNLELIGFEEVEDIRKKILYIIQVMPHNFQNYFFYDLYSQRLLPIFDEVFEDRESSWLIRHYLYIMYVRNQPKQWHQHVLQYAKSLPYNSVFTSDLLTELKDIYQFGYLNAGQLAITKQIIKIILAKHHLKKNKVTNQDVSRVKDSSLPEVYD